VEGKYNKTIGQLKALMYKISGWYLLRLLVKSVLISDPNKLSWEYELFINKKFVISKVHMKPPNTINIKNVTKGGWKKLSKKINNEKNTIER
jgi:hypothetical protein